MHRRFLPENSSISILLYRGPFVLEAASHFSTDMLPCPSVPLTLSPRPSYSVYRNSSKCRDSLQNRLRTYETFSMLKYSLARDPKNTRGGGRERGKWLVWGERTPGARQLALLSQLLITRPFSMRVISVAYAHLHQIK